MRFFKKPLIFILFSVMGILTIMFLVTGIWIGTSVGDHCQNMMSHYQQEDCVAALMIAVEDETLSFGERNSAIWALGQLGDEKALSVIEKFYTGDVPDREPWNEVLSQYEMKKALNLLSDGFNITAFTWRWGID